MPAPSYTANATLHALTERLASHSKLMNPISPTDLALSLSPQALAAAASAYRQPAPPPQLPLLQLIGRHQEIPAPVEEGEKGKFDGEAGAAEAERCPRGHEWPARGRHGEVRISGMSEEEIDRFVLDVGLVLRREFDVWVEQCWTEAFHHLFTHTLPTLLIQLILTGASPTFLRRQIVHGGPVLDNLFQTQMLDLLYHELELRLSGTRPHGEARGESSAMGMASAVAATAGGLLGAGGFGAQPSPASSSNALPRDGICFHDLAYAHGVPVSEDDHGTCLCQLTSCLSCFHETAIQRKGPVSLLPFELVNTPVAKGWTGEIETEAQARERLSGSLRKPDNPISVRPIPEGRGFVKNPKSTQRPNVPQPPQMFLHPQMTDVLAVEEHLRWRLKEMGASDPAVESRYGASTNSPAALEGVDLPEERDDDGDNESVNGKNGSKGRMIKVAKGRGKVRRVLNPGPKKDKGKICYLPKQFADEEPGVRNMALVLTYRHFVKLLHQTAVTSSPFSYASYSKDVEELNRVHPIALYRRLAEPAVSRRKIQTETKAWQECMDRWAEELGAREKTHGNIRVNESRHAEAVDYYTRAISLDPKKTVYFSNRAVALNTLGLHERAELDCRYIIARDSKNGKAFYQRALARRGMEKYREAEGDLREVLKYQPGNESAKKLMAIVRGEVARLPKLSAKDVMDF